MNKEMMTQGDQRQMAISGGTAWGTENVMSSDILIPRVLLMQGMSDFVMSRKASQGDIVRSTNTEVLGNPDEPVTFIPISSFSTWIVQEKVGQKYEYRKQEPLTARNQNAPWEFTENGTQWRRVKCFNLYALLKKDVDAERTELAKVGKNGEFPDPDKALLPVLISFRSTSYPAAKKIVTHFARAQKFGAPAAVNMFNLTCAQQKNDLGTFYTYDVESAGKTSHEDLATAHEWYDTLNKANVKIDDTGMQEDASTAPPTDQY